MKRSGEGMAVKKLAAEFIGAFMWVAALLGAGLLSAGAQTAATGVVGVGLALGFTVAACGYAIGHVSGGHFNPAVTLALWAAGKLVSGDVVRYAIAQCAGAISAAGVFFVVASTKAGFAPGDFASNTFQPLGPYPMSSAFLLELLLTGFLAMVVVSTSSRRTPQGFAPLAMGLALAAIHIVAGPLTGASVNPARSLATALFAVKAGVLGQVWLFIAAPVIGGLMGGFLGSWLQEK